MNRSGKFAVTAKGEGAPLSIHLPHVFSLWPSYCCPYGGIHALPGTLVVLSAMMTVFPVLGCDFFHISPSEEEEFGVGFWYVENPDGNTTDDDTECVNYTSEFHVDGKMRFARMLAFLGSFMALSLAVAVLFPACYNVDMPKYWKAVSVSCVCQSMITILFLVSLQ